MLSPTLCPPQLGECHSPRSFGTERKMLHKQRLTLSLCSALGTTCSPGSSRPSTWMPWMQSTEGSRDNSLGAGKGVGPSPAVFFHHFLRALTSAMHSCHSSRGPVPDQGSLGLERTMLSGAVRPTSFMENAPFPHPQPHTNPKDQPGCTVGASRVVLCFPLFEGGGVFFNAPNPSLPQH